MSKKTAASLSKRSDLNEMILDYFYLVNVKTMMIMPALVPINSVKRASVAEE